MIPLLRKDIDKQCHRYKNTYSPTQSVHSLSDLDDFHNLSSSTWPHSPQVDSDFKNVEVNTPKKPKKLILMHLFQHLE